ncbi:MAG TPA: nucleotide exchange factor GrpE [Solirubrobacteraceae bacterium]|jgi:molecular chaperone GrpE
MSDMAEEQTIEEEPTPGADTPGAGHGPTAPGEARDTDGVHPSDGVHEPDGIEDDDGGEDAGEIEGDLDELVRTAAERDEYLALAQRTQADFENYRKRVAREASLAQERGVAKLAKELLSALDNLDRALDAAAKDDPLLDGVRLVRAELDSALARVGVESFSPTGEVFDPALHEAMAQQPVEGAESGTVVEVYQPGYRLGTSIIRPARVVVAA